MATTSRSPAGYADTTSINLNRLLSRLDRIVLVDPSPQLRKSPYERARVSANIEHARTLLLNLEHNASTIPSKSKKTELQTDLQQKRELIKQLNQRIYELNQLDDTASEGSVDSDEEDEDQFPSYAPRVKTEAGRDVTTSTEGNEAFQNAAQGLASQLRRRGKAEAEGLGAQTASGNSLFPSQPTATTGGPSLAQTEALLSHDRNEQESLTTNLLDMAKLLKQQSIQFGQTLEGDKSVVDRALSGLDKNTQNMDAASRRMGTLRRMTEGKGWLARMKLYGFIVGLWLVAFLIVFVGPKIRF
ncbi:synaptobrevin [Decorospora gaudefroyi]|uniref:Synaptobrevin n=1 Tax=Decorospora gaudefroyi TaxID=184978 RepID=A0A6A5KBB1_9PLEO|nr:synaptobrevin [Decorospora gaudefroyi]